MQSARDHKVQNHPVIVTQPNADAFADALLEIELNIG
jgi:hypothetical protein